MIKRLISFILTLVLLVAIPLEARYRYNPYTRKLDWYEAAADVDLGDLGDITLTGLANGDILYYNGTAWVNLATGANTNVLTLAAGIPSWAAPGAPAAHAPTHLAAGADPVDHDQLLNYLAAQHLTLPNTLAAVLTDHNLLAHTALGLFDQSADVDHDATTNYLAAQHLTLPSTIAAVLTDHNLAAHTALGLYDAPGDVDHNLTTNYVANQHINWTAAASNFSTSEDFFLAWTEAADHASITQTAVAGIEDQPLIFIDDARTGLTADELSEATVRLDAEGVYAFVIGDGRFYANDVSEFNADTYQWEDVFVTWADAADHMFIDQNSEAGIEDQALVRIEDSREGATVDEISEASLRIDGEGYGLVVIAKSYLEGAVTVRGDTTFEYDILTDWDHASDHAVITQAAVAGTADQPLIFIDDDRTGLTANVQGEASLVIEAQGTYAFTILNGLGYFADGAQFWGNSIVANDKTLHFGQTSQSYFQWDLNSTKDGLFRLNLRTTASDSTVVFMTATDAAVNLMDEHEDYVSPTFVLTNVQGADANDYAGVVIGERAQADVKVAHYFDFYAMTGAIDGSVATADELPAIFRFGASGTAVPGYSTTGGDVLMEGALEVDGNVQHAAYNRYDYIYWIESFDHGIAANRYSQMWDITSLNVQGNGTNTIDTTPSHITLTTDNNAVGDNEGTITYKQIILRSRLNRSEFSVDLGQTANTQFYCGWNTSQTNAMVAAADEYVIVFFDVADNANWQIKVGDGATEDVFTSAVAADTNDIRHEIWVESDGTVHWRVNGTELDITGSVDNLMTANGHYLIVCQAQSVTGAAAIVAEMCYVENEKTKAN